MMGKECISALIVVQRSMHNSHIVRGADTSRRNNMKKLLTSNETLYRLIRTVIQSVIGILVANADVIIGTFEINEVWKPIIVALVMAILSPIMAELGKNNSEEEN